MVLPSGAVTVLEHHLHFRKRCVRAGRPEQLFVTATGRRSASWATQRRWVDKKGLVGRLATGDLL